MLDENRQRRLADNESRFRAINERLQAGVADLCARDEPVAFVCECAQLECREAVELSCDAYEAVRSDPTHFLVAPGHAMPSVERVVAEGGGYHVIEKIDVGAARARATDPRH